jgi:hypothetical protein
VQLGAGQSEEDVGGVRGVEAIRAILLDGQILTDLDTGWGPAWVLLQPVLLFASGLFLYDSNDSRRAAAPSGSTDGSRLPGAPPVRVATGGALQDVR